MSAPMTLREQYELYKMLLNDSRSPWEREALESMRRRIVRRSAGPLARPLLLLRFFARAIVLYCPLLVAAAALMALTAVTGGDIARASVLACLMTGVEAALNIAHLVASRPGKSGGRTGKHFR